MNNKELKKLLNITNEELLKRIAENSKLLRKNKGWSIETCAKYAGLSYRTIYNLENMSNKPGLISLYKLSKALEINMEDLWKGEDE